MQDSATKSRGEDPEIVFGHGPGQMGRIILRGLFFVDVQRTE